MSMSIINYSELTQHMPNIILVIGWGVVFFWSPACQTTRMKLTQNRGLQSWIR